MVESTGVHSEWRGCRSEMRGKDPSLAVLDGKTWRRRVRQTVQTRHRTDERTVDVMLSLVIALRGGDHQCRP